MGCYKKLKKKEEKKIEVVVPSGAVPGQQISITRNGTRMTYKVPDGAIQGSTITVVAQVKPSNKRVDKYNAAICKLDQVEAGTEMVQAELQEAGMMEEPVVNEKLGSAEEKIDEATAALEKKV